MVCMETLTSSCAFLAVESMRVNSEMGLTRLEAEYENLIVIGKAFFRKTPRGRVVI